ncbi:hypothetical protein GA0070611_2413 [Micromonospora auratinigra]|uniref:Uncharacterized protein n=1 Tax=Micromonospora auratinigra TaxID=261654 RepID=A0A1A8ZIK5_9ACTN|nr:hypothetical protein GA0070611_2413 [Micromonospora auratinigra]
MRRPGDRGRHGSGRRDAPPGRGGRRGVPRSGRGPRSRRRHRRRRKGSAGAGRTHCGWPRHAGRGRRWGRGAWGWGCPRRRRLRHRRAGLGSPCRSGRRWGSGPIRGGWCRVRRCEALRCGRSRSGGRLLVRGRHGRHRHRRAGQHRVARLVRGSGGGAAEVLAGRAYRRVVRTEHGGPDGGHAAVVAAGLVPVAEFLGHAGQVEAEREHQRVGLAAAALTGRVRLLQHPSRRRRVVGLPVQPGQQVTGGQHVRVVLPVRRSGRRDRVREQPSGGGEVARRAQGEGLVVRGGQRGGV